MTEKMLKFVSLEKKMPTKRAADQRRADFNEIYDEFDGDRATAQASRCSQCGIPYCQVHCPVQNNIPDWLMMTAAGRLAEAYEVSQATNNFRRIGSAKAPASLKKDLSRLPSAPLKNTSRIRPGKEAGSSRLSRLSNLNSPSELSARARVGWRRRMSFAKKAIRSMSMTAMIGSAG